MSAVATTPAEQNLATQLSKNLEHLTQLKVEDVVQASKLGEMFSFSSAAPLVEKTKAICQSLASSRLDLASEAKLQALVNVTNELIRCIGEFRNFSPTQQPNATQRRDGLVIQFRSAFDQAFDVFAGVLAISQRQGMEQYEAEAKAAAERLKAFIDEQHTSFDTYRKSAEKEINETLGKAKQAAQEVGIVQHSTFFKLEANGHKKMARCWLGVTVLLAAATVYAAWVNYDRTFALLEKASATTESSATQSPSQGTTPLTIQLAIAKLIGFSILFSAVLWSGRIYRAHRHNYVINQHRQNALSTFEAFAKATDDSPTKNAVLLQATQCIFGPQSTGYLSQERETEGYPQILEIVRSAASAKS